MNSIGDFFKEGDSPNPSANPAELRIEVRWGKTIALVSVNVVDDLIRSFGEMISNSD